MNKFIKTIYVDMVRYDKQYLGWSKFVIGALVVGMLRG